MLKQLELRLLELKKEFEIGQTRMEETERQQTTLRETLLRISGAIQVLEEMIASAESAGDQVAESASPEIAMSAENPL